MMLGLLSCDENFFLLLSMMNPCLLQPDMKPYLEERGMSLRQWAWEQTELDTPLDLGAFCVLRNMLEVRPCRDRRNACRDRGDRGDRLNMSSFSSFQTPIVVVGPGKKLSSRKGNQSMLSNGTEFRFHEDDLAKIYDPCIPIVVAWDGSTQFWPTEIVSRESLNHWKLSTLWQQLDIAQVHFKRAEFQDFSEEDQQVLFGLGSSLEKSKQVILKYIPSGETPTRVRTGLVGPLLPHVDSGPSLPLDQPARRKTRKEEKDEEQARRARRDRERGAPRRDREGRDPAPEPVPGTSGTSGTPAGTPAASSDDDPYREDIDTVSDEDPDEDLSQKKKGRQRQRCPESGCEEDFQRSAQLKDHLYHKHRKANKPNCDVCGKTYQYWRGVARHKK